MLHESQLRIQTISRVHEFLYESENLRDIDMQRFLEELVLDIQAVYYEPRVAEINFEIAAEPLALPVDRAVPVGLIMNELVTNAIKHAFPPDLPTNGEKRITLFLRKEASGVSFGISDNGIGIPQEILTRQSLTLGFELIKVLTQQLQGEISVRPGEAGRGSRVEVSLSA
jgi:two-component sensor histidine kinase